MKLSKDYDRVAHALKSYLNVIALYFSARFDNLLSSLPTAIILYFYDKSFTNYIPRPPAAPVIITYSLVYFFFNFLRLND